MTAPDLTEGQVWKLGGCRTGSGPDATLIPIMPLSGGTARSYAHGDAVFDVRWHDGTPWQTSRFSRAFWDALLAGGDLRLVSGPGSPWPIAP